MAGKPSFRRERAALKAGPCCIAGVDEAGRGPLAGPVVVSAVVLDPKRLPKLACDSKAINAARRDEAFAEIMAVAQAISVVSLPPQDIDRLNIRGATLAGMARAVAGLPLVPDLVLVDGRDRPAVAMNCVAIIDGDALCLSIAAASIIAKVTRDRLMARLDREFPLYGFAGHKGYATQAHRDAIAAHGPCIHHRFSFAPLKPPQPIPAQDMLLPFDLAV